ncbi:YlbD family protein [Evansella cellulosilytica]|uniref:Coat protein n=1 Tax=Evansella cellulosilytica (strain ATCC 21833 / DSM 2522 / FERM P-1141 / JCM 9156 / N-4) TaxID=649639 RepID=E6TUI9_EVAC2|nr:YlbD family protein [Evansella cellulosilytica]ADU30879.1 hypothetical protein Bcell_2622 [Evansella cellulosilytica DSM 2522]
MGKLHPDVKKFKVFVKKNPYVLKEVKKGEKTLQDLFEEWLLFGEDDDIWETYKEDVGEEEEELEEEEDGEEDNEDEEDSKSDKKKKSEKNSINTQDLLAMLKKMNFNDLQNHLTQFSGVLASVQELLGQFKPTQQQSSGESTNTDRQQQNAPFSFRDD